MNVKIEQSWQEQLQEEFEKPYFQQLTQFVRNEYASQTVYPSGGEIFNAFNHSPFHHTKVVILGQDPYHEPNQAHGLSFSVREGVPFPPSLRNIIKEVVADTGATPPTHGDLTRWADQGVLLLNATLTVQAHRAGSHQGKGWEQLTDAVVKRLASQREHLVFILWGAYAQRKGAFIDPARHLVLQSPHPSPLSAHRGFFGNKHFTQANDYLQAHGKSAIVW